MNKPKLSLPSLSSAPSPAPDTPRKPSRPALKLAPVNKSAPALLPNSPPPTLHPSSDGDDARLANIHEALSLLSIVNHDPSTHSSSSHHHHHLPSPPISSSNTNNSSSSFSFSSSSSSFPSSSNNPANPSSTSLSANPRSNRPPPQSPSRPQHSRSSSQPLCEKDLVDLGRLGEGASGEVRKVRHLPTGLIMAKKTIDTSPNPDIHKQILRELSFNRSCSASFIVKYYGAFLEDVDSRIAICMEYCEGGSLDAILKQVHRRGGAIGEKILGKISEAVLHGLVYLHDHKIIHRDIKPSNILVSKDGLFKICDFGVSGELINSFAGTFTGTSMYMAPERIQGDKYTITSDIWSLGLTIYEAATNDFPVPKELSSAPIDLLMYIVKMKPPQLHDDPQSGLKWTSSFRKFIAACLEKDPQVRPTPQAILGCTWIKKSEQRTVDIAAWTAMVWGWT